MQNSTQKGLKIGQKLRNLRMKNEFSQEYVAEMLEVSQKTYSNMENEKTSISIDTLKKIANLYNVDMLELLQNGNVVVQHNNFTDSSPMQGIIYNHASDELINQLKERIDDLKKENEAKEKRIESLEKILFKK